jgi:sugar lactone lactonase YvrE
MTDVRCALEMRSILGESPMWHVDERRLYWLDLQRPALYRFDPASGRNEQVKADLGRYVGGLVFRADGGLIVDKEDGLHVLDRASGRLTPLADPEPDLPGNWFNDAKVDRQGRLWAGTGDRGETAATGSLYVFAADHSWRAVDRNIICSNGPAFSPDGRFAYFSDSYIQQVVRYDIDPKTGAVGPRQPFVTVTDANVFPDGMTVDADGGVWVAHWDGWRIVRYTPDGQVERIVTLPVPRPTAMAFGGTDHRTLYITTASTGLSDAQLAEAPLSGSLFVCEPGVVGLAEPAYAG